ncbi:MAG TPA: hypothetical protein VNQ79_13180 [Blastocatellia bacterium]|nr:hypothetical protein [Blastocatellia bacterium]
MNRIKTVQTFQRVLFVIALVAIAHTVRPFTARDVTRHLFRTTQSFSFILPGGAVRTMEQADYLAAVLDGSFRDDELQPSVVPQWRVNNSDPALAQSQMQFNPEHDLVLPPAVSEKPEKVVRCPLAAAREARLRVMAATAKSRILTQRSDRTEEAIAIRLPASRTERQRSAESSLDSGSEPAMIAVALPEVRHADVSVLMQNDLPGLQEAVRTFTTRSRHNTCDSVLPDVSRVRAAPAPVAKPAVWREIGLTDLRAQAAAMKKAVGPGLTIQYLPVSKGQKIEVKPARTCTLGDLVTRC